MSYLEHLMENALCALENNENCHHAKQAFREKLVNIEMSKETGVSLDDVWEMALYVWFTWYPAKVEEWT